jgi:protein TonB
VKSRTVIVSALLHVVVFGLALQVSKSKASRRATSVAVVGEKKKAEKKPEDKPKPPPPKPKKVASVEPEVAKEAPAPTHAPEPTAAPAPVETGLTMGNDDGPGISLGGKGPAKPAGPAQPGAGGKQAGGALKKDKVLAPKDDNPEEDTCTEAPSKPAPLQKPSEIEYTQEARANGIEGRLVLRVTIGADGSVIKVEVVSSVDAALDAAAIAAVKTWVFKPSMRCGKAMAGGVFNVARTFELGD